MLLLNTLILYLNVVAALVKLKLASWLLPLVNSPELVLAGRNWDCRGLLIYLFFASSDLSILPFPTVNLASERAVESPWNLLSRTDREASNLSPLQHIQYKWVLHDKRLYCHYFKIYSLLILFILDFNYLENICRQLLISLRAHYTNVCLSIHWQIFNQGLTLKLKVAKFSFCSAYHRLQSVYHYSTVLYYWTAL